MQKVYVPVHILVMLIQPFLHQFYIFVVVFYEAHMSAGTEQLPSGIRDPVIHIFCNIRCTQVIPSADDQRRLLDVFQLLCHIIVLQCSLRSILIWSPSYDVGFSAFLYRTAQALRRILCLLLLLRGEACILFQLPHKPDHCNLR